MLTYYRDKTVSLGINMQENLNILFICDGFLQARWKTKSTLAFLGDRMELKKKICIDS